MISEEKYTVTDEDIKEFNRIQEERLRTAAESQPINFEEHDLPFGEPGRAELKKIYSWTLEDATDEQKKWDESLGHRMPLSQWQAARTLKDLSERYEKTGNKSIILSALYVCLLDDLPVPQWCAQNYLNAFRAVRKRREISWDDVFGRPHPKGTHKGNVSNDMAKVYSRIMDVKKTSPETPIDTVLFENVGKELGIGGKTKTMEFYYKEKKWHESLEKSVEKLLEEDKLIMRTIIQKRLDSEKE